MHKSVLGGNMDIQLDLFDKTEVDKLRTELTQKIDHVKDRSDNVRRGLFARHNELAKKDQDIFFMLETIAQHVINLEQKMDWLRTCVEDKHESDIMELKEKVM